MGFEAQEDMFPLDLIFISKVHVITLSPTLNMSSIVYSIPKPTIFLWGLVWSKGMGVSAHAVRLEYLIRVFMYIVYQFHVKLILH